MSRRRRRWTIFLGTLALLGIALALFPAVASATFLRTLVRRELRTRTGEGADVGRVHVGWTSGAVVDNVLIPSAPRARQGERPALRLEHAATRVSVLRAAAAAMTGGEVDAAIEAKKASLYLELLPDGRTNLALPDEAAAPGQPGPAREGPLRLPCSAKARVQIEELDAEVADFTRPGGAVRRTVLKGLRFLSRVHVARDGTTTAAPEETTPTVTFDELRVTVEPSEGPPSLLLLVTRPRVAIDATYFASREATGVPAFLVSARRLSASVPTIARVESDLFSPLDVTMAAAVLDQTPQGHSLARLTLDGEQVEPRSGRVHFAAALDLASGTLPLARELGTEKLDIEKTLAHLAPALAPAPGNRVPPLDLASKGSAAVAFDDASRFERDRTLESIDDAGRFDLGAGTLKGSLFLERYLAALGKLGLGDTVMQAIGPGLDFDAVHGSYRIEKGVVTIPDLVLERKDFALAVKGTGKLADGRYDLHLVMSGKPGSDVSKAFAALEEAGGVRVTGVVGGGFEIVTPSSSDFAKAMARKGAEKAQEKAEKKVEEESKKALDRLFERKRK